MKYDDTSVSTHNLKWREGHSKSILKKSKELKELTSSPGEIIWQTSRCFL